MEADGGDGEEEEEEGKRGIAGLPCNKQSMAQGKIWRW